MSSNTMGTPGASASTRRAGSGLDLWILLAAAAVALVAVLVSAYTAPKALDPPRNLGIAQKIFYVHVVNVLPTYLSFVLSAIGAVAFLRTGRDGWDRFSHASAEVGLFFCSLLLITGSIWGRASWGHWWELGDLRLQTTAVLWFVYVGYLFLRAFAVGDQMRRTAAIVAIAGTLVIPFVTFALRFAGGRTIHPPSDEQNAAISLAQRICTIAFAVIFAYLLRLRVVVAHAEASAEEAAVLGESAADPSGLRVGLGASR